MSAGKRKTAKPAWVTALLEWFRAEQRAMPWRDRPEPYPVWISEIMLQQTQVTTVMPYFERFIRQFPTVEALAEADQQDVLKAWEGLGYYSRARNLHRAAGVVVSQHAGRVPSTAAGLKALPGIGDYTAAAIASIAFGERQAAVDGNVLRVYARFRACDDDTSTPAFRQRVTAALQRVVPADEPGDFNQAMMELGAMVCRPRNPRCEVCPLAPSCRARQQGRTAELPVRRKRRARPHYDIGVAVIVRRGRILIARRRPDQMLGGLWEFPGGKLHDGESCEDAIRRELIEETGLKVTVGERLCTVRHAYTHLEVTLHVYRCTSPRGTPKPLCSDEVRWVAPHELRKLPFPAADHPIIEKIEADR